MKRLWELPEPELDALLATLTAEEAEHLLYDWEEWGRPEQVWRPSDAILELYSCGRGWGKTRTGAEAARWVAEHPLEYFGHRDVSKWRGALESWRPCWGHVDQCHIKPRGMGGCNSDGATVYLCRGHHMEQEGRTDAFEAKYGVDLRAEGARQHAGEDEMPW